MVSHIPLFIIERKRPWVLTKRSSIASSLSESKWRNFLVVSAFLAFTLLQDYLYNVFNQEIITTLHLSALQYSSFQSIYLYALTLSLIPVGILYDVIASKRLLVYASMLGLLATSLCLTQNFWLWILSRGLCGMVNACVFIGGLKVIENCFQDKRAFVTGLFFALGNLGGVIASGPYVYLKAFVSWQTILLIHVFISLVIIGFCKFGLWDMDDETFHPEVSLFMAELKNHLMKLSLILFNKDIWLCGLFAGLFLLSDTLVAWTWGIPYLTQSYALSESDAGLIFIAFIVGVTLGCPFIGLIAIKVSHLKYLMMGAGFLSFVIWCFILHHWIQSWMALMISFGWLGFLGGAQVLVFEHIQKFISPSSKSVAFALILVIMNGVNATASPCFGWILEYNWDGRMKQGIPMYSGLCLEQSLMVLAISYLVSAMLMLFVKEKVKFNNIPSASLSLRRE